MKSFCKTQVQLAIQNYDDAFGEEDTTSVFAGNHDGTNDDDGTRYKDDNGNEDAGVFAG